MGATAGRLVRGELWLTGRRQQTWTRKLQPQLTLVLGILDWPSWDRKETDTNGVFLSGYVVKLHWFYSPRKGGTGLSSVVYDAVSCGQEKGLEGKEKK